jgi:hypothetical protein
MLSLTSTGTPWSGPRSRPALALAVERLGDRERLRIELDDAVQARPVPVDRLDPRQAVAHDALRRRPSLGHRQRKRHRTALLACER